MEYVSSGIGAKIIAENDTVSDNCDITQDINIESSVLRSHTVLVRPTHLNSSGPFEFHLQPQTNQYMQLHTHRLHARVKINKKDGSNFITASDQVALVNNAGNSLFHNIEIDVDGQTISQLTNTYSDYKGYLENLLSFGPKAGDLEPGGWFMDEPGKFNKIHKVMDQSRAFVTRMNWTDGTESEDTEGEFIFSLPSDFLQMKKLLIPGKKITIRLTRSPDVKCLMAAADLYEIEIKDLRLYMKYVELDNRLHAAHMNAYTNHGLQYHLTKTDIKQVSIPSDLISYSSSNLFNGAHPRTIIVGFVHQNGFNGAIAKNPYNFEHFDLQSIEISVGGQKIPSDPYKLDFKKNSCVRAFRDLFDSVGIRNDDGERISLKHYKKGCALYGFDLTKDGCAGWELHDPNEGAIGVDVTFNEILTHPIKLLAFGVYDKYLQMKEGENISLVDHKK